MQCPISPPITKWAKIKGNKTKSSFLSPTRIDRKNVRLQTNQKDQDGKANADTSVIRDKCISTRSLIVSVVVLSSRVLLLLGYKGLEENVYRPCGHNVYVGKDVNCLKRLYVVISWQAVWT